MYDLTMTPQLEYVLENWEIVICVQNIGKNWYLLKKS